MTSPTLLRVQVEDLRGNCLVVDVDTATVTDDVREWVDGWLAATAADLGLHPTRVCELVVADLVQRHHDAAAYRRECERRGVLAL